METPTKLENALNDVISALLSGRSAEIRESEEFKTLIENKNLLTKPDIIDAKIFYPLKKAVQEAVSEVNNFQLQYAHLATHIFMNHQFYFWQLRGIFSEFEGSCCCADKARFVLSYFLKVAKGEAEIMDSWHSNSFAQPNLNEPSLWINYIEALCNLHSGNLKKFNEVRKKIEELYL